jgi:hypothetical protein
MKDNFCVISFADKEPYLSEVKQLEKLCIESELKFKLYDFEWLKKTYVYETNKKLFNNKKCGYCAWKPYIILDALKSYDKVLYLDSSMVFDKNHIKEYIENNNYIISTKTALIMREHTKQETFDIMECNENVYKSACQVWAGAILVDKQAECFLLEWLYYCLMEDCISDEFNENINHDLKSCLYDQSIYSVLYEKYGIEKIINAQNKDGEKYFYFADTREYTHRENIKCVFGENIMNLQDLLCYTYHDTYISNGSVCYGTKII